MGPRGSSGGRACCWPETTARGSTPTTNSPYRPLQRSAGAWGSPSESSSARLSRWDSHRRAPTSCSPEGAGLAARPGSEHRALVPDVDAQPPDPAVLDLVGAARLHLELRVVVLRPAGDREQREHAVALEADRVEPALDVLVGGVRVVE